MRKSEAVRFLVVHDLLWGTGCGLILQACRRCRFALRWATPILTKTSEILQEKALAPDALRSENRDTVMPILVVEDEAKVARALKEGRERIPIVPAVRGPRFRSTRIYAPSGDGGLRCCAYHSTAPQGGLNPWR